MQITTTRDICKELVENCFSVARAEEIGLSPEMEAAWRTLLVDYENLPLDEYLPGGLKYRFRRFGRYYFLPSSGELLPLPHVDYFQGRDINRVTGGIVRKFAPLLPQSFNNPFMKELIRFNFRQFPVENEMLVNPWQVDVHLIRVIAELAMIGEPTPEGIHRDGAEFVTVHLAEIHNAEGGEVTIYDEDEQPLHTLKLNKLLDSYLFRDDRVFHSAAPIHSIDGKRQGVRSILTFDYHYRPELERPE